MNTDGAKKPHVKKSVLNWLKGGSEVKPFIALPVRSLSSQIKIALCA
jgi:hypothetical protein